MTNILFINSCIRPNSRTNELSTHLLNILEGEITELNLYNENISPIDYLELERKSRRVNPEKITDDEFIYARQFAAADIIVISAPFWDLSFPSVLKIYLEHINVSGITFKYSEEGIPCGLCRAKKLYYITTSGGFINDFNYGYNYVKALSEMFYGIKDIKLFTAEGLDILGADVKAIMDDAKNRITAHEKNN